MNKFGVCRCRNAYSKKPVVTELTVYEKFPDAVLDYRERIKGSIYNPAKDIWLVFFDGERMVMLEKLVLKREIIPSEGVMLEKLVWEKVIVPTEQEVDDET